LRGNKETDRQGRASAPQDMVLDPQCKSYVPKNEAVLRGGHYFCSDQCARAFLSE
jgi:hypothetical protein